MREGSDEAREMIGESADGGEFRSVRFSLHSKSSLGLREDDPPFVLPPLPRCARGVPRAGSTQAGTLKPRSREKFIPAPLQVGGEWIVAKPQPKPQTRTPNPNPNPKP